MRRVAELESAASRVMKKHDDYIAGPHHFWIHFWCGLVFGGVVCTWISWSFFESTAVALVTASVGALVIAGGVASRVEDVFAGV